MPDANAHPGARRADTPGPAAAHALPGDAINEGAPTEAPLSISGPANRPPDGHDKPGLCPFYPA
jgi:hypothetical protein